MARRCMAPAKTEGNVATGRCPERPWTGHTGIIVVGGVALAVWFCEKHHKEAFEED